MADNALDVHLAEYNSLRGEMLNRIQIQFNAVTWLFAAIAAVSAFVTFTYDKIGIHDLPWLIQIVSVFCPIVVSPVAFMVFDHTVMIHRLGAYLATTLRPAIIASVHDETVLRWDPLKDAPKGAVTAIRYFFFLLGSWFLYFLLIPVPTVLITFTAGWWRWPFPAVLVIDWLLTLAFLYSSAVIWKERSAWLDLRRI
jgi:hypothetical protein